MIVFVDLETTGLDPSKHGILEIASIITDDQLNEIATFHRVLSHEASKDIVIGGLDQELIEELWRVSETVYYMHTNNGLWQDSAKSDHRAHHVDPEFAAWVKTYCPEKSPLAGNTINFDRSFLKAHMPKSHENLHYRNMDMTTMNLMAARFWPDLFMNVPNQGKSTHRAIDDIRGSLEIARYYARNLKACQI